MIDPTPARAEFRRRYGSEPRLFYAPGRVNLIGEHTDYNDGFVLPMAIDRGTLVAAAPRSDRRLRAASLALDVALDLDLDAPLPRRSGGFIDFVQGVAQVLDGAGPRLPGVDLLVSSDVPLGAGLSSSASLAVAIGLAFARLGGRRMEEADRVAMALACQRAEHEYVGTACGVMDAFVALLAREGSALLIDCRSLEHREVPLAGARAAIVICDTGVKHALASSPYNERREQCFAAVRALRAAHPAARALRDIPGVDLDRAQSLLDPALHRRSRHVISEIVRTHAAAACMDAGDLAGFGRLMDASHRSLRDDFEVSCPELDFLVERASSVRGVYGSRMTGAGFGGCTISLVAPDAVDALSETLSRSYRDRFGRTPALFASRACGGAGELADAPDERG